MSPRTRRWIGWGAALALTVLAVQWVDSGEAPALRDRADAELVASAEPARPSIAAAPAATAPDIRLDRLRREPYPALQSDPFASDRDLAGNGRSGLQPSEGGGSGVVPRGPPPPPPLPFTYMGKMLEDGESVVFLTRGERNYVVRQGATIDGQYRVDQIGARTMVLTYLPANAKQTLAIGSAP